MSERRFPFLNRVVISGTVARKLALRTNKSGVATLKLPLTVSLPTLSDDSTRQRLSTIRVSVFIVGQLAVSCERLLSTGAEIIVEGRLSSPPAHGSVSRLEVHAERVQLVDSSGALQFLERDFLEQSSKQSADSSSDSQSDNVDNVTEKALPEKKVSEKSISVKTVSKPTATKKVAPAQDAKRDVSEKPKPTRTRRKRQVAATESSGSEATSESITVSKAEVGDGEKPKPRRRRSVKKRTTQRELGRTSTSAKSQDTVVSVSDSPSVDATVSEKSKPVSKDRKPSGSRRTERRPRNATKDSAKGDVKVKDSKKTNKPKPSSDSPFELVESKDSFDPFLLED